MGAWGAGLYSNDEASDLKALLGSVLRLPFSGEELVELLKREMAVQADDVTFWLVLADQFEKKGILHPETSKRAISILRNETDISHLHALGMSEADLKIRKKQNTKLLNALLSPRPEKKRKTLKEPQNHLVAARDIIIFPTQDGTSRNPYFASGTEKFNANGWGMAQIHEVGHEFGYLSWVSLFVLLWPHAHKPSFDDAASSKPTGILQFGTLSKTHFKKMELEIIGVGPIRKDAPAARPGAHTARSAVLNDVSISNAFYRILD